MTAKKVSNVLADLGSHARTIGRFDTGDVASVYPARYGRSFRQQRERTCIIHALQHVRQNGLVLDLPCGTGRLTPILVERGFQVAGADSSPHMVELAKRNWKTLQTLKAGFASRSVTFEVRDVMRTGYADGQFDAVICNRLFHHFNESETRIRAFRELSRICTGPVIVSYFDSYAFDAWKRRLRYALQGRKPNDRIAIPHGLFVDDLQQAGLELVTTISILRGLSPMRYVIARNRQAASRRFAA